MIYPILCKIGYVLAVTIVSLLVVGTGLVRNVELNKGPDIRVLIVALQLGQIELDAMDVADLMKRIQIGKEEEHGIKAGMFSFVPSGTQEQNITTAMFLNIYL